MGNFKAFYILLKLSLKGHSDNNANALEERYLHAVLRNTDDLILFKLICTVLGNHGGLFNIPTLMALSRKPGPKSILALNAVSAIRRRTNLDQDEEIARFFTQEYWQPVWKGTKENFITYIACLANALSDRPFDAEVMDNLADKIMMEMAVDLSPYQTFKEIRLITAGWETERGIKRVLAGVNEQMMLDNALSTTDIIKNSDSQKEENLINMRSDYLITRLNLTVDYNQFHYLLKVAEVLNRR